MLKNIIVSMGLRKPAKWIRDGYLLFVNYLQDMINYYRYSNVFFDKNYEKIESDIIMSYHSIEKGFLYKNKRERFSKLKVIALISQLRRMNNLSILKVNTQISAAINILLKYYEYHEERDINISDFFSRKDYNWLLTLAEREDFEPVYRVSKLNFYENIDKKFDEFSYSRKSIRDFSEKIVSDDLILKAINLANNAPSVCNRQSCKNYIIQDKSTIDKILKIQGGFSGHEKNVRKLIILVSNKNYFFSIGERNQLYIDGGIYLMNLLYSLHFFNIATCPANWGKCVKEDKLIRKVVNLPFNEQIICIIPVGFANDEIVYTHSKRRIAKENTVFI